MTQPRPAVGWHIVSQTPGMGRSPTGGYVQGVSVTYQLDGGPSGTVFVPNDQYTPDMVRQAITAHAANVVAIHQMTGQV